MLTWGLNRPFLVTLCLELRLCAKSLFMKNRFYLYLYLICKLLGVYPTHQPIRAHLLFINLLWLVDMWDSTHHLTICISTDLKWKVQIESGTCFKKIRLICVKLNPKVVLIFMFWHRGKRQLRNQLLNAANDFFFEIVFPWPLKDKILHNSSLCTNTG